MTNSSNIRENLNERSAKTKIHWEIITTGSHPQDLSDVPLLLPTLGQYHPLLPLGHNPQRSWGKITTTPLPQGMSLIFPFSFLPHSPVLDPIEIDSHPSASYCSKDGVLWSRDTCQYQNWVPSQTNHSFKGRWECTISHLGKKATQILRKADL